MRKLMQRIQQEPVMFQGVIQATLALTVTLGLKLKAEDIAAILGVSAALLSFLTRTQVTPLVNPRKDSLPLVHDGSGISKLSTAAHS